MFKFKEGILSKWIQAKGNGKTSTRLTLKSFSVRSLEIQLRKQSKKETKMTFSQNLPFV
jgi:hypothetical protein